MLTYFGIDAIQETIYLCLLDLPSATTRELLREHPSISPTEMDEALSGLEGRGMVSRWLRSRHRYAAVSPEVVLSEWMQQQTSAVRSAQITISTLTERFHRVPRSVDPSAVIEVARGQTALDRWAREATEARTEKRAFEQPPYEVPRRALSPFEATSLARGVRHRVIYDRAAIEARVGLLALRDGIQAGEEARVVGELPLRLLLVDDRLALLPLQQGHLTEECLLIVGRSALLTALSALFEATWQQALPLNLDQVDGLDRSGPILDESLTTTAGLLAAGLSDQAIAQKLGISTRTVERHVQRLTATLGAKTRYQAGVLAARHGWT